MFSGEQRTIVREWCVGPLLFRFDSWTLVEWRGSECRRKIGKFHVLNRKGHVDLFWTHSSYAHVLWTRVVLQIDHVLENHPSFPWLAEDAKAKWVSTITCFFFILWKCWPGYCETIGQVAMAGITSKYELVTLQKPSRPSIPWGDIGSHCATEGCALDVWIDKRSSRVAGLSWKQIPSCRLNIERHGLCHFVCCFLCVYMCLNLLLFGGCLVRVIRIATLADLWLDSCLWCWRLSLSVFGYNPVISGK